MGQLFDDEILSVVLKFTNPNRGEMVDAGKVASGLSLALDNVIRKSVSAGKALDDIHTGIKRLEPELKALEKRSGLIQGQAFALKSAQQILARYTPARLEKMAEVQASRIAEMSGASALRRQLEKHGTQIQKLVDATDDRKKRASGRVPDSDLTREQRLLSIIRQEARELRHELTQKLAEADRANWSRPFVSSRAQVSTPELRALEQQHGDIYTRLTIAGISGGTTARARRPAHSTDYGIKLGSGQAEETTPGYLGPAAIALDRRIGVINEFLRHTKVALTTPALAHGILTSYSQQRQYQERIQASRGRSQQSKVEVRHGDELLLAAMAGFNTRTVNDATPGYHEAARLQRQITAHMQNPARLQKMATIEAMLNQPWARPPRQFGTAEINAFVGKYKNNPAVEAIQPAAQMAASVGLTGHKYFDLTNIMLAGQSAGRAAANTRAAMVQLSSQRVLTGASGDEVVLSKARQRMLAEGSRGERGAVTMDFLNPFGWGRKKQQTAGSPDPGSIRAEMRYDALQAKLRKLADTVDATVRSFQHFEQAVAPQRRRAADMQYAERDLAIERGLAGGRISLETQGRRLAARGARASSLASRRDEAAISAQESLEHSLGFSSLEAQTSLDFARERQVRRAKQLARVQKPGGGRRYSDKDIAEMTGAMTALPGMRAARTEYAAQAAGLSAGPELEALRRQTAEKYALARYGAGPEFKGARGVYAGRVEDLLRSETPYQRTQRKRSAIAEDERASQKELGAQEADRTKRVELLEQGAQQKRAINAQKLGEKKKKIDDDVAQNAMKAQKKVDGLEEAGRAARAKFAKQEAAMAARGAGGRGTGGAGAGAGGGRFGGMFGGESRGGYGFGLGLMALVAYDEALKTFIKDMAIYSARTEMMEFSTKRMAQVSGLNVQEVDAEVESIKRLNVTTQAAHQTVQRLMMMQIDLAKATKLVSVAQDLAAISGADAMETISRLSQAVLTGYTRNLHMMGLQVTSIGVMRELKAQRRAEGKTGEPSMMEQRQALVNKVILEGAKVAGTYERSMSTAGGQFAYLRKEVQETMNVLGKEFLPVFSKTMSSMSGGLHYAQEHAEGFATLTKVLASLGATANVLGSMAFIRWMIGGSKILSKASPWLAVAAGVGTYLFLDQDKAKADKSVAADQKKLIDERVALLKREREELLKSKDGSAAWSNSWEINTKSLASFAEQQKGISEDLTKKLAEEYNRRIVDLDAYANHTVSIWKVLGDLFSLKGGGPGTKSASGMPYEQGGFESYHAFQERAKKEDLLQRKGESDLDFRKRMVARHMAGGGVSGEAIQAEAARQREEASRVKLLGPTIVNEMRQRVASAVASGQAADELLEKYSKKVEDVSGQLTLKALKSSGTPREKAQLDYEAAKDEIEKHFREIDEYERKGKSRAPQDIQEYQEYVKAKGGGDFAEGQKKIEQQKADRADVEVALKRNLGIELSKISANTQVQINQTREQVQVERILGNVVAGNYASEESGLAAVLELKKKNIDLGKTVRKDDVDAAKEARAAADAEAERARDALVQKAMLSAKERTRVDLQRRSEVQARDILEATGADQVDAIGRAYDVRIAENEANELDDAKRLAERQRLRYEKQDALHQLQLRRAGMAAQGNVSVFENAQRVAEAMAGSSAFDPMFGRRTELEQGKVDIERRRGEQLAAAQYTYDQMSQVPGQDVDELKQRRAEAIDAANAQAREDAVKLGEDAKRSAGERLADRYKQGLQIKEQMLHGLATSDAQEKAVAKNVHELRLQYIQAEFEARGKTLEAERAKNQEILEEESAKLQEMLTERRKQVEEVKAFGSEFFMTAITDHARGLRDMLFGKVKGMGATVAGNALGMLLGKVKFSLPGLETVDKEGVHHATKLGELLSGTVLGTKVPSEKEVQEQLAKVTTLNSTATSENTQALRSLTDAAITIMQHLGIAYTPVPRTIPAVSTGPSYTPVPSYTPIFGGADSSNVMIMHALGGGGGAASPSFGGGGVGSSLYGLGLPQFLGRTRGSASDVPDVLSTASMLNALGAPLDAAASQRQLQQVLSSTNFAKAAKGTSPSGLIAMMKAGQDLSSFSPSTIFQGFPGGGGSGGSGGGRLSSTVSKDVMGAVMAGTGIYQAATNVGKGARGDLFAAGGVLQAGAGAVQLAAKAIGPAAPAIEAGLEVASLVANLFGSMFMDPKQKRANQMANYLGMLQYMAPAQIARTSSLAGNMVSEGRGGLATDTGIRSNLLQVTSPYMESINPNPAWYSQPLQYLLGSNRPSVYQAPGLPAGQFPSADSLQGSQQYNYAGVPGQVLYNDLPGNAVPTNYGGVMNININALDSKSVIDRAPDIAAAIQKQLQLGGSLAASLQSAVFGVG